MFRLCGWGKSRSVYERKIKIKDRRYEARKMQGAEGSKECE